MKKQLLTLFIVAFFAATGIVTAQYTQPITNLAIPATKAAIILDGVADASYSDVQTMMIAKQASLGIIPYLADEGLDFKAQFQVCWDTSYLYILCEITDDIAENVPHGGENQWTWDNAEAFIDLDTASTPVNVANHNCQLRFNRGLKNLAGADSIVTQSTNSVPVTDFIFWVNNDLNGTDVGWEFEVAIPWGVAKYPGTKTKMLEQQAEGVIGFDFAAADADGAGTGTEGGRNVAGGSQAFWDLDNPEGEGAEDAAYNTRTRLGLVTLLGVPVPPAPTKASGILPNYAVTAITAYPNPSNGALTFANLEGVKSIDIYNVTGSLVQTVLVTGKQVDVTGLQRGIYFARPNMDNQISQSIKLVVE